MNIVQSYVRNNHCYSGACRRKVRTIHIETRLVLEKEERMLLASWDTASATFCPHAVVQKDRITQLFPWEYKERDSKNPYSDSGIHILLFCYKKENGLPIIEEEQYRNLAELCGVLCKKYSLEVRRDLYCKGIGKNSAAFAKGVEKRMAIMDYHPLPSFTVKITSASLCIRTGPADHFPVIATARRNEVYRIVRKENGWGKLEESNGYLCLAYTKRIKSIHHQTELPVQ